MSARTPLWLLLTLSFFFAAPVSAKKTAAQDMPGDRVLLLDEFLRLAAANDTEFEEILIAELALRYRRDLSLPARDLVLSVKREHAFLLGNRNEERKTTVSLSRLFPLVGTELTGSYSGSPSAGSEVGSSALEFTLAQPIAKNAFGRSTRLLDKIVGLEVEVARHQIVEAYEDYLASIVAFYLDWHEAFENLKVGRSSYSENLKLLKNMRARRKSKIANPIDVNKIRLQVLAKKEKLVDLEERYASRLNLVKRAIRVDVARTLVPRLPNEFQHPDAPFEEEFREFREGSRTYRILRLLEEKSSLEVSREADDLLPSIKLLLTYKRKGDRDGLRNPEDRVIGGVSLEWPLGHQVDRAERGTAEIERKRTALSTRNTHHRLRADLRNLRERIEREKRLMKIADEKISLARAVLRDESENYTFAKASLNDYISAVNRLDANRFNQIFHRVLWRKLILEWRRLTDDLVDLEGVRKEHSGYFKPRGD